MFQKIKQEYTPYWSWECYKNQMYNKEFLETDKQECIDFMNDTEKFGLAMIEVCEKWKNTMINHLTNNSINRVAFLGQCAVCYRLGYSDKLTKMCWKELSENKKYLANIKAANVIKKWILNRKLKTTSMNGKKNVMKVESQMKLNFI